MRSLTYGRQLPEKNVDPGETWFDAIDDNTELDDAHSHNGVDSPLLSGPGSSTAYRQSVLAASWAALGDGSGQYSQVITLPIIAGRQLQYDDISIAFRLSTGELVYPTVLKTSATTYTVYTNDNSKAYTAIYST